MAITKRKEDDHNIIALQSYNPKTSAKVYWSILKTFYNGKKFQLFLHSR